MALPITSIITAGRPGATVAPSKPPAPRTPAAKAAGAATDPFAPMTPAQIEQTIQKYTKGYGTPQTDTQIQSSAQGMLDPIIAAITRNVGAQTSAASQSIRGNAASLASSLAGLDYGAPYQGAEAKQAAIDAALQQSLTGGGQQLAGDLSSRLSAIGGGSVQQAAQGLAQRGAAIGTNAQAVGSAGLTNLVANEAANRAYGQQLPGIAQRQGLQDIAGVEQAGVKTIGDQTAQTMQSLPSIIENLRSAAQNLTGQKAAAAASLYGELTGQNITKATAKAGLVGSENRAVATQNAAAIRANASSKAAAAKAARPDPSLSKVYGHVVDSNGNTIPGANGKPVPVTSSKAAAKPKPLTTADRARLTKVAEDLRYGVAPKQQFNTQTQTWMDVPNTGTPNSSYTEAYNQLVSEGATPKWAQATVNRLYKPGEFGRPLSAKQKAMAKGRQDAQSAVQAGTYGPQAPTGGR